METKEEKQYVYIGIDDSGQLSNNEKYFVYGLILIVGKENVLNFKREYKSIQKEIFKKEEYKNVEELKGYTLKLKDKSRLLNLIRKNFTSSLFVKNQNIDKKEILNNKSTNGRYKDFILKLLIKKTLKQLIKEEKINPFKKIHLIISIDEQSTKSNGIYSLKDAIYEELKVGVINFNYKFKTSPIIFSDLVIDLNYKKSHHDILIQSADLIAHDTWRYKMFNNFKLKVNLLLKFP